MPGTLRLTADLFVRGFRDALLGLLAIYRIDRDQLAEQEKKELDAKNKPEPISILAKRRATKRGPPPKEK